MTTQIKGASHNENRVRLWQNFEGKNGEKLPANQVKTPMEGKREKEETIQSKKKQKQGQSTRTLGWNLSHIRGSPNRTIRLQVRGVDP